MKTVTLQIGNSDNKLTQKDWYSFAMDTNLLVQKYACDIHFKGGSDPISPYQNAAWVFTVSEGMAFILKEALIDLRKSNQQDSVAWTEGETLFV